MPNNDPTSRDAVNAKLAALDAQFNTNPSFGLMGVLEAQAGKSTNAPTINDTPGSAGAGTEDKSTPEWFETLLSAQRARDAETAQHLNSIDQRLQNISAPQAVQPQTEAIDPNDPIVQINELKAGQHNIRLKTEYNRAQNALRAAKERHGDSFTLTEQDLANAWNKSIGTNADNAERANWDQYFEQEHYSRERPALIKRLSDLEKQVNNPSAGRDVVGDMSLPRGNRMTVPTQNAASRGEFDEDVYQEAMKTMGKTQFRGFNSALYAAQQRKMSRAG